MRLLPPWDCVQGTSPTFLSWTYPLSPLAPKELVVCYIRNYYIRWSSLSTFPFSRLCAFSRCLYFFLSAYVGCVLCARFCPAVSLVGWELALILAAFISTLITRGVTIVCVYRNRKTGRKN